MDMSKLGSPYGPYTDNPAAAGKKLAIDEVMESQLKERD